MRQMDPIYRSSILSSPTNIETCSCQCPMSGSIPIYYNSNQQSCTIGTIRKRRDHYSNDDQDRSSPTD